MDAPNILNVFTQRGEKTIASIRNILSQKSDGLLMHAYLKYLNIAADVIVPLCDYAKNDLINVYGLNPNKLITINNICDVVNIDKWICNSEPMSFEYIISVGRLVPQKGQWHLLRAFAKVHKVFPDLNLFYQVLHVQDPGVPCSM